MGTNKRYGDRIDEQVARRQAAAPPPSPPWHPRGNAFPTRWILRNGRWGTIFGEIESVDVYRGGRSFTVYQAVTIEESLRSDLGEFPTGDAAVEAAWAAFIERVQRRR